MKFKLKILFSNTLLLFLLPLEKISAHEAYVIPTKDFWNEIIRPLSFHAIDALKDPHNIRITLSVITGVILVYLLNFIFRLTPIGRYGEKSIEKLAVFGPFLVRAAIAGSFFFSASTMSFLGPELMISHMPFATLIQLGLFVSSFMIAFGFLTEIAGLLALVMFSFSFFVFGTYMITYFNYLGEIIVLLLFGMRSFSVDRKFFGPLGFMRKYWEHYETSIVRIFYGLALAYAAINVKLLHPDLTYQVVTNWHLTQFHWLFPSDPLLVVLGAGLAELAIGIFIIIGFELRLTVLISLFYITLSLFYFRELVWPHLMLYGISLNLLVQPEVLTLDHFFFSRHKSHKKWWKRPFLPHTKIGKSIRHEKMVGK